MHLLIFSDNSSVARESVPLRVPVCSVFNLFKLGRLDRIIEGRNLEDMSQKKRMEMSKMRM